MSFLCGSLYAFSVKGRIIMQHFGLLNCSRKVLKGEEGGLPWKDLDSNRKLSWACNGNYSPLSSEFSPRNVEERRES